MRSYIRNSVAPKSSTLHHSFISDHHCPNILSPTHSYICLNWLSIITYYI